MFVPIHVTISGDEASCREFEVSATCPDDPVTKVAKKIMRKGEKSDRMRPLTCWRADGRVEIVYMSLALAASPSDGSNLKQVVCHSCGLFMQVKSRSKKFCLQCAEQRKRLQLR